MSIETKFYAPGTLQLPGPVGRLVRFLFGLVVLNVFVQLLGILVQPAIRQELTDWSVPTHASFWITVMLFFWVFAYVVNIGFSRNWRRKPQIALLVAALVLEIQAYAQHGALWSPALGWLTLLWLLYVTGHLGFAFLLSAILGTPGCEMRAFHHLWSRLTGRPTLEHQCPGVLHKIDTWELRRKNRVAREEGA